MNKRYPYILCIITNTHLFLGFRIQSAMKSSTSTPTLRPILLTTSHETLTLYLDPPSSISIPLAAFPTFVNNLSDANVDTAVNKSAEPAISSPNFLLFLLLFPAAKAEVEVEVE